MTTEKQTYAERWVNAIATLLEDLQDCRRSKHAGSDCAPGDHADEARAKLRQNSLSAEDGGDGTQTLRFSDRSRVRMSTEGETLNLELLDASSESEEQTTFLAQVEPQETREALDVGVAARVFFDMSGKAETTIRVYKARWAHFTDWCAAERKDPVPANYETLEEYVRHVALSGKGASTTRQALAAIRLAHQGMGREAPNTDGLTEMASEIVAADFVPAAERQQPLGDDALAAIRLTAKIPRAGRGGSQETVEEADVRGVADLALVHLLSDAGLKVSEAAALTWSKLSLGGKPGTAFVAAPAIPENRSPRLDEASETRLALGDDAAKALLELKERLVKSGEFSESGSVFGLDGKAAARRLEATAKAAGLDGKYGSVSGRLGLAQRMHRKGAPVEALVKQGRWASESDAPRFPRPRPEEFDPRPWM